MSTSDRAKKIVAGIYSAAAEKIYEPVVVRRAFPLFGGNVNELALQQGRSAVATAHGRPILDMPVGTAYFTVQMAKEHDGIVVGVDIARGMVEQAMRTARAQGCSNVWPVQGDAHRLPFPDGAFGAILCTNGLQVIPGLDRSISELARVLGPGGVMYTSVISVPVSRALPRATARKLPTMLRSGFDVAEVISDAGLYVTSVSRERFATLIEAIKPTDD